MGMGRIDRVSCTRGTRSQRLCSRGLTTHACVCAPDDGIIKHAVKSMRRAYCITICFWFCLLPHIDDGIVGVWRFRTHTHTCFNT